jgi:hypothetical protein
MRSYCRFSKPHSVRHFTRNRTFNLNLTLRSLGGTCRTKLLCSFFYGFVRRFVGNGADKSGHDRIGTAAQGRRYRIAVNGGHSFYADHLVLGEGTVGRVKDPCLCGTFVKSVRCGRAGARRFRLR